MKKEFCSYDIALILKELGFNEPCFKYYDLSENLIWCDYDHPIMTQKYESDKISAPLYQQAIDFLETKGYYIVVKPHQSNDKTEIVYKYDLYVLDDENELFTYIENVMIIECMRDKYSVYEQAILRAIEVLKENK